MGLGKTLQGISLLWTLLSSGHPTLGGELVAKRIVIVCPTSLVGNWDSECQKWLKVRVCCIHICSPRYALCPLPVGSLRCPSCAHASGVSDDKSMCHYAQGRPLRTLALCEASREDVIDSIRQFLSPRNYYQVNACTALSARICM